MIYVIQEDNLATDYRTVHAGTSAHEALLAASKFRSCRISVFRKGKRYVVEAKPPTGEGEA